MIYRVERRENPFVQVDKGFINDKRLGFKEKGILLYFLSKPDGWNFYAEEIASNSSDGVSAVKAGIHNLMKSGYIVRGERIRNEKGQLGPYEYIVKEVPATCENPTQENPTQENPTQENPTQENPTQENPTQENPTQENPTQENRTLVKNESSNIYKSNIKSKNIPLPPAGDCEQKDSKTALMERFEIFYKAFPKHKSRGDAEKAWKTLKPDDKKLAEIMDGLDRAKHSPDWKKENGRFIPYPATWLRAKGWEDEQNTGSSASKWHTEQKKGWGGYLC